MGKKSPLLIQVYFFSIWFQYHIRKLIMRNIYLYNLSGFMNLFKWLLRCILIQIFAAFRTSRETIILAPSTYRSWAKAEAGSSHPDSDGMGLTSAISNTQNVHLLLRQERFNEARLPAYLVINHDIKSSKFKTLNSRPFFILLMQYTIHQFMEEKL